MVEMINSVVALESVVTLLEGLILTAPSAELGEKGVRASEGAEVKSLIEMRLDEVARSASSKARKKREIVRASSHVDDDELTSIVALLKRLSVSQGNIAPQLALRLSASRRPTRRQINVLLQELIRAGVLKKDRR